jgi:alcohol dehydrogenase YqhD (iron-dependent ADH family)
MKRFTYYNPTKVFFGEDILDRFGTVIAEKARKILILTGRKSVYTNGIFEKVVSALKDFEIQWVVYDNIQSNPILNDVHNAIQIAKTENIDAILALGGGSVIDTAKAVSAGFFYEGDVWDYYLQLKKIKNAIPIYSILTISGTSSEMNGTAVLTNEQTQEKRSIKSELLYPRATWIDPSFQSTIPSNQLSYTAMDILSHVFEFYFAGYSTYFMDTVSEGIIQTVMHTVPLLKVNPNDLDARSEFAWAATWALNGFTACGREHGDFSSHRIGHAISAMYGIPHGQTLAIVQPAWMRYCYMNDIPKFSQFGKNIFHLVGPAEKIAPEGIFHFMNWIHNVLQLTTSLSDLGIRAEDIKKIANNGSISYPLGALKILNQTDVIHILRMSNY